MRDIEKFVQVVTIALLTVAMTIGVLFIAYLDGGF